MHYKGKKLEDISCTPQVFVPPREMLVWDNDSNGNERVFEPKKVTVLAIVSSDKLNGRVIAEKGTAFLRFGHCAEKPRVYSTLRQISRWLANGNGEVTESDGAEGALCKSSMHYFSTNGDVSSEGRPIRIRKWDDTEWHEPTLDYMGLDG